MNAHHTFTAAATSASSLSTSWLIDASKAARAAEEARAIGDIAMAERLELQAERYYSEADRCEGRARWYRAHANLRVVDPSYEVEFREYVE